MFFFFPVQLTGCSNNSSHGCSRTPFNSILSLTVKGINGGYHLESEEEEEEEEEEEGESSAHYLYLGSGLGWGRWVG